ncbi:neurofibromin 1 [Rhinolophus ferrumequinum]|uniref:Neurofibromin 1 n=1 Tax=Rhinolophus ferrumequinum TaxID=59479 RepID=A0A7J7TFK7_RHIFE|nr:neurofibromin 1 [Rhinolophus ferrumequinum]
MLSSAPPRNSPLSFEVCATVYTRQLATPY